MAADVCVPADVCVATGAAQHASALKASVAVVEGLRRVFKGGRLYDVIGADGVNALAKATATVTDVGAQPKVLAQLGRLSTVTAVDDLAAKLGPDPALKAKLVKAREKAEAVAQVGWVGMRVCRCVCACVCRTGPS